jgi:AmpE protein
MAETLIAAVIALALSHAVPAVSKLRSYEWYINWIRWLGKTFKGNTAAQGRFGFFVGILLPLIVVAVAQYFLDGVLYGLLGFLFALCGLLFAWGPRDLDLDVEAVVEATDTEIRQKAAEKLFHQDECVSLDGPSLVEAVFRCALWRWFGVLFWFFVLGVFGAMLYRLAALSSQGYIKRMLPGTQHDAARTLLAFLNWPVSHLMTFTLALAADFDSVLSSWRDWHAQNGITLNNGFLGLAARASVGPVEAPALLELRDAISLVWRILILWLGAIALFVIAGFVN